MKQKQKPIKLLIELASRHRWKLGFSCFFAALGALLALAPYAIVSRLANEWINPTIDSAYVQQLVMIALAAALLRFLLQGASSMLSHASAYHLMYDMRVRLTNKLGRMPLGFFSENHSGRLKKTISEDVERIEQLVAHHLPDLIASLLMPVITFVFLLTVDWRMALVSLVPIPIALGVQAWMMKKSGGKEMEQYYATLGKMNETITEFVRAMPVIKAFQLTVDSFSPYRQAVTTYSELWIQLSRRKVPLYALYQVIIESGLIVILPFGLWFYQEGSLTLPDFVLFLLLGAGLTASLKQLSSLGHTVHNTLESVKRMEEIMSEPEMIAANDGSKRPLKAFDIKFQQVHFSYGARTVLTDINLTVPERTVTALVGPSGAGKSTMAQLIARFWDPESGEIRLGGIPLREMAVEDVMEQVSFVFQDVSVLNDTVWANIRMGKENITEEQIMNAAKAAQAHDFIMALPNGYETMIGEGGVRLSGGERQRLAIARALCKNAPVLVLDEATAFADPENESKIQEALSRLLTDKTVVVIAHRLSTIVDADQIVVMDAGRIVGKGSHEELLRSCALYEGMWHRYQEAEDWTLERRHSHA